MQTKPYDRRRLAQAVAAAVVSVTLWTGGVTSGFPFAYQHTYAAAAAESTASNIVRPNQIYSYSILSGDLKKLSARYPDLIKLSSAGQSEYGRELWSIDLGRGPAVVLLNGSHHAREWMTTVWLMAMIEYYAKAYDNNLAWKGIPVRDLLDHVTFRIVPMVNPDGVTLQQQGAIAFPAADRPALLRMNGGSANFKRWKANAKGVDLNRQYPAEWPTIANAASAPRYMNYKGKSPLAAKEAKAMAELANAIMPEIAVSYHTAGEIVYWHFHTKQANLGRDRSIASTFAAMTGYRLIQPSANPSGGGFTDWFITKFARPALTPELGRPTGETHVALSEWGRIWAKNRDTGWMFAERAYQLWMSRNTAELAAGEIRLFDAKTGYQTPELRAKRLGAVYAGKYKLLRTKGDWVEIKTPAGAQWVTSRNTLAGPFEAPESDSVTAIAQAPLYRTPMDGKPLQDYLAAAQTVRALEQWQDWILVQTAAGARWVQSKWVEPSQTDSGQGDGGSGQTGDGGESNTGGADGSDPTGTSPGASASDEQTNGSTSSSTSGDGTEPAVDSPSSTSDSDVQSSNPAVN